jgi:predicted nucleotidyltransferase component of viral defense system
MPEKFYQDKVYPLQDQILSLVQEASVEFYLTGGTALSRYYLNHRYSDDLDFFVNQHPDFKAPCQKVIELIKHSNLDLETGTTSDSFIRIFIKKDLIQIKVDFVNDVPFHYGGFEKFETFHRVDNWRNILSNKICALTRLEPKDVVDLLFIAKRYPFNWEEVLAEAKEKDLWVDPLGVSKVIKDFNPDFFKTIKWVKPITKDKLVKNLKTLHRDIFYGNINSLVLE